MDRLAAESFKTQQRVEEPHEVLTLFTQLMYGYLPKFYQIDTKEKEPFQTKFKNEFSYDCGGPMRDTLLQICEELMSPVLPLFKPTANNRSSIEPETDCYQLNEKCTEPHNLLKLSFCGYLLGWSLMSIGSLNLDFPSAFYTRLCHGLDYTYTLSDIFSMDKLLANRLE